MSDQAAENTDREIWRGPDKGNGDFYSDSIYVTESGGIGINCGGYVIVKPVREWHRLAMSRSAGAGECVIPLSDANDLDEVVHELGIEDSEVTPAEAVRELKAEIERLRSAGAGEGWRHSDYSDLIRKRIGQEFDGECHLSASEAENVAFLLDHIAVLAEQKPSAWSNARGKLIDDRTKRAWGNPPEYGVPLYGRPALPRAPSPDAGKTCHLGPECKTLEGDHCSDPLCSWHGPDALATHPSVAGMEALDKFVGFVLRWSDDKKLTDYEVRSIIAHHPLVSDLRKATATQHDSRSREGK